MKAALATVLLAMAASSLRAGETPWFRGVNQAGSQGVWFTDAAVAPIPGDVVFSLRESFYVLRDVLSPGDSASALDTAVQVAWTPLPGLQAGVGGSLLAATYTREASYNLRAFGNPLVRVKYGHGVAGGFAAGVAVQFLLPTVEVSSEAAQLAYVASFKALLSYSFGPWAELHLNAGFVEDRSAASFANGVMPAQRFALGINDASHWDYAVGAVGRIAPLFLDPFLEVSGSLGGASTHAPVTARITPGIRLDTAYGAPLEATVGANVRLTGAPSDAAGYAGLPQWELFAQVALHALTTRQSERAWERGPCSLDAECGPQQQCVAAACAYSPPPAAVPLAPDPHNAPAPVPTPSLGPSPTPAPASPSLPLVRSTVAQVHGKVHVTNGNKPIPGAVISLPALKLRWVSDANGNFSGTLAEGVYDVVITAKKHDELRRRLDVRGGETVTMDVELKPYRRGHR